MKIIIEHEAFTASTTSLIVAERLLETIRILEKKPKTAIEVFKDIPIYQDISECPKPKADNIFDTKDISDIPEKIIKPKLPRFNPAWLEKHIDFNKSKIVRYSNPCSTLHGKCGQKCYQTELWIDTNGSLDTCDCEFYDLDELKQTLDSYIKKYSDDVLKKTKKPTHSHCSKERLQQVADLVNQGCTNKQIAERLGISPTSTATYKGDCKRLGMLN